MITEIISIGFAFLYYVFCVVFLCELQEETNSNIETIVILLFILIIAPIIVPILLAIFLSRKFKIYERK